MKTSLLAGGVCFGILGVTAAALFVTEIGENRRLRDANRQLSEELQAAKAALAVLAEGEQNAASTLAGVRAKSEELKAQLAELESANNPSEEADAPSVTPRPYRVQAYLGQNPLGWAWMIPRKVSKHPRTGAVTYEPVLWLDENLRRNFVVHQTNIVEREVQPTYIDHNYYPQPYYYSYPAYGWGGKPGTNSPPRPPQQPAPPAFNPGSGAVYPQRLGTPAGSIKTRPQKLATRAGQIKTLPVVNSPDQPLRVR